MVVLETQHGTKGQKATLNLEDCLQEYEEMKPSVAAVEGKDIIMPIGFTGAGKSTLLAFLAGKKIIKDGYKIMVDPTDVSPEDFKIGHSTKSQTKGVSAKEINGKLYVDTAGGDDNRSYAIDLANFLSINEVFRTCNSVVPMLVINYAGIFDKRGEGLAQLCDYYSRMLGGAEASIAKSFYFISHLQNTGTMRKETRLLQ